MLSAPRRTVHHREALEWLTEHPAEPNTSVVTSLPDVSELPDFTFEEWRSWFLSAARAVLDWIPAGGVAIFFQTDVLSRGLWVDKGFLVLSAGAAQECPLLWHKVVCRVPPATASPGRAGYSHLLCFSRPPLPAFRADLPDVLADGGFKATEKAMGVEACLFACRFVLEATSTHTVVDPFCGHGSVLAAANALGLDAVGIDKSERCCRIARRFAIPSAEAG